MIKVNGILGKEKISIISYLRYWVINPLFKKILWFFLNKLHKNTVKELYKKRVDEIYLPNSYNQSYEVSEKKCPGGKMLLLKYRKAGNYSEGRIFNYEKI